jgi:hypothetical protein
MDVSALGKSMATLKLSLMAPASANVTLAGLASTATSLPARWVGTTKCAQAMVSQ